MIALLLILSMPFSLAGRMESSAAAKTVVRCLSGRQAADCYALSAAGKKPYGGQARILSEVDQHLTLPGSGLDQLQSKLDPEGLEKYGQSGTQPGTLAQPQAGSTPDGSTFDIPAENLCHSKYDHYYADEPGVYAYWSMCEPGTPAMIHDYVGEFDLTSANHAFGTGQIIGGAPGPVSDEETAARTGSSSDHIVGQGIPVNSHQGTLFTWVKADATDYPVSTVYFGAVKAKSRVMIKVNTVKGSPDNLCFNAIFVNAPGETFTAQQCGYKPGSWHRVVQTWDEGQLHLYVDGLGVKSVSYQGGLDDTIFYYSLFPGCCNTGKEMTLAKAGIANQAWNEEQVKSDFAPRWDSVPEGGVFVTNKKLGVIHRDVLGVADRELDISTPELRKILIEGFKEAGVTALRYGAGHGGIEVDLSDWRGKAGCTKTAGEIAVPRNTTSEDTIDNYLGNIAKPLGLDTVMTVNYGTDPGSCNAGGDPIANGADLVTYINKTKGFDVRRWEIGNEVYSAASEADFHADPHTGASYALNEKDFYAKMKAVDPKIQIGVPIGMATFRWQTEFDYPVLAGGSYDAVIWHNYPIVSPITDGATLYPDRVASNLKRSRGTLLKLQTELLSHGKDPGAIWVTEWDGEVQGFRWSKQTMGAVEPIFVASQLAEYMQGGVELATWWTQAIPNGCARQNYDPRGDSAYSWWQCGGSSLVYVSPTPKANEMDTGLKPGDLTPAGRAFQILSQSGFVTEGEHMLRTLNDETSAPWLQSYAATHEGSYAVILINKDRDMSHKVPVQIANQASGSSVETWSYGRSQYDQTRSGNWSVPPTHTSMSKWQGRYEVTLPAWSISVLIFHR